MPTPIKITEEMLPGIYALAAKGKSLTQICAALLESHGVTVSPSAVRKHLTKRRVEREVVAKATVREQLAKTVLSDIDVLDSEKRRLRRLAGRLYATAAKPLPPGLDAVDELAARAAIGATCELYLKTVDRLTKVVHTKLHFAGADAPDDALTSLADAARRVDSRLDRLAATGSEKEVPPGDSPEPGG